MAEKNMKSVKQVLYDKLKRIEEDYVRPAAAPIINTAVDALNAMNKVGWYYNPAAVAARAIGLPAQTPRPTGKDVGALGKGVLAGTGLVMNPAFALKTAGLGGAIGGLAGTYGEIFGPDNFDADKIRESMMRGVGQGFVSGATFTPMGALSNPFLTKALASRALENAPAWTRPVTQGAANVAEGLGFAKLTGGDYTPTSALIDYVTGATFKPFLGPTGQPIPKAPKKTMAESFYEAERVASKYPEEAYGARNISGKTPEPIRSLYPEEISGSGIEVPPEKTMFVTAAGERLPVPTIDGKPISHEGAVGNKLDYMAKTGAIRTSVGGTQVNFELSTPPTPEQMAQLRSIAGDRDVYFDINTGNATAKVGKGKFGDFLKGVTDFFSPQPGAAVKWSGLQPGFLNFQGSKSNWLSSVRDTRPPHQAAIENAINTGDFLKAKGIAQSIPAGDPYRESMIQLVNRLLPQPIQEKAMGQMLKRIGVTQ